MRSLRILWGFALAAAAWALATVCWLLPVQANAEVPQAPTQQAVLTIVPSLQDGNLVISGTLTGAGQPVANADVSIALDSQPLGKTTTGADGRYSGSTKMPDVGAHVLAAAFVGDKTYRPAAATQNFTVDPPAPATTAPPATVITAQLAPSPVAAGSVLAVTGNVSSGGVPIDSSRVDISCDFGGITILGVTDASGNFSANVSLPATGQPSKLTVTVSFAGDNRFSAAKASFQAPVTAASPSAVASPTTAASTSAPPDPGADATPSVVSSSAAMTLQNPVTPATTFGIVLGIVGLGAVGALCVLWVLAWRRHDLMPGERRGFGSDFGRRSPSA